MKKSNIKIQRGGKTATGANAVVTVGLYTIQKTANGDFIIYKMNYMDGREKSFLNAVRKTVRKAISENRISIAGQIRGQRRIVREEKSCGHLYHAEFKWVKTRSDLFSRMCMAERSLALAEKHLTRRESAAGYLNAELCAREFAELTVKYNAAAKLDAEIKHARQSYNASKYATLLGEISVFAD